MSGLPDPATGLAILVTAILGAMAAVTLLNLATFPRLRHPRPDDGRHGDAAADAAGGRAKDTPDRKSTRLNSSH